MTHDTPQRIIQVDTLDWRGILIEVRYEPDWLPGGFMAHLELESVEPARVPLPVTDTGYRSAFLAVSEVDRAGGPVNFAIEWLNNMARRRKWVEHDLAARQLALF